jgi:RNA polymerase sigma factor for flagellar operon FliA
VQLRTVSGAVVAVLARPAAAPVPAPPPDPAPVREEPPSATAALWETYRRTPTRPVRDRILLHYTPLVRSVAHRVATGLPSHVDVGDLVQAGVFGLVDAVERFDPERCPRFESYAAQRIRGAILDELRAQDWVPRTVRGRARELERARDLLEARLGRLPTDQELAGDLGVPLRDLHTARRHVQLVSVEALAETGGLSEVLADDTAVDPGAVVQDRETVRQLSRAVDELGERDRDVIRMYYLENRTLAEIGRVLGVTESRVCQLHTRLVTRLRTRLRDQAAG